MLRERAILTSKNDQAVAVNDDAIKVFRGGKKRYLLYRYGGQHMLRYELPCSASDFSEATGSAVPYVYSTRGHPYDVVAKFKTLLIMKWNQTKSPSFT